jgi:type VI secretion system secreted protein VgrG
MWAGSGWGSVSIPRIGQEVVVEFLEGDPDRPLVIGSVYNAEQMPPHGLPSAGMVSGFKSRSTPGGGGHNEMSADDTKGKEKITIHAQYDMSTTVLHDDTQAVKNDRTITVDGKHTETVTKAITIKGDDTHTETIAKDMTLTVTGGKRSETVNKDITIVSETGKIHITASTEIQLQVGASKLLMKSDGSIELKGVSLAIDGSASVDVHGGRVTSKADSSHEIEAPLVKSDGTATNTVKGGMVMLNP